jgi:putative transposase
VELLIVHGPEDTLIADSQRRFFSLAELCARFGISRETAYKWIERYEADGSSGLEDRSRRPHACPHRTPTMVVEALPEFRRLRRTWGAEKPIRIHSRRKPDWNGPSRSTYSDLLSRHGLLSGKERRGDPGHPDRPMTPMDEPNSIWSADFKGPFRTRDRRYCYPLTVVDGFSRYLLACQGLRSTAVRLSKPDWVEAFARFAHPPARAQDTPIISPVPIF